MKLAVNNNQITNDLNTLIQITGMQDFTIVWVNSENNAYMYYVRGTQGLSPAVESGKWVKDLRIKYKSLVSMVDDNFDFNTNNSTDISSVWTWYDYTFDRIGSQPGFMDWKCWQREIEAISLVQASGDINTNWSVFTTLEQQALCRVSLTNISATNLVLTFPSASDRLAISLEYDRENRNARSKRYEVMRMYLFSKLTINDCFQTLNTVLTNSLVSLYVDGIKSFDEHGYAGLKDYLLSTDGWSTNGFLQQNYSVIDGSGDSLQDVANVLVVEIMENGMY